MNLSKLVFAALLGSLMLLGACLSPTDSNCGGLACESALQVNVEGPSSGSFRIELYTSPEGQRLVIECASASECANPVRYSGFTPSTLYVDVIVGNNRSTFQVTPNYEQVQPNGPDCPPICAFAAIRVTPSGVVAL